MPFTIVRQDITKIKVDAIVNAANTTLQMGGGVCGAIFKAAGASELQVACDKLTPIQTGEAVITPGFRLLAKYVIHTAGPVYSDGKHCEEGLLRSCYTNSLKRAVENSCESIAFPLISSGIYGYPKAEALRVATSAIQDFLADHDIEVSLVMFDKAAVDVSMKLLGEVKAFIDENYIDDYVDTRRHNQLLQVEMDALQIAAVDAPKSIIFEEMKTGLEDLVGDLDEPFAQTLLRLIDSKGMTDVEVYKRANLDRKLFSKIRNNKGYMPSKRTAIALAVALELSLDETDDLLERAGYALSRSQKFDVIIQYFIKSCKYDIFEINEVLFSYDQPLLGG
ncbi:macro domain-containing protein [Paenibacillus agricola]|uniref:RNase III inhibitor n=1 Tax=Paenibacillus agricola TaxID=2716264 RepID=A0ABX0JFU0_9BACL|nr:macro domain-containing protein [Paenibacillus agricola]NHN35339.1 RNase III inhibitor [Paenibacillus agricola]